MANGLHTPFDVDFDFVPPPFLPPPVQTQQGALDMLENVYVKAGGTGKCLHGGGDGHGSPNQISLSQVSPALVASHTGDT